MGRSLEINHRTFYEPKLRWKSGNAYIRFYDPEKKPLQKDFALHTSDKNTAEQLFQQRRFEYLHGLLEPWSQKRQDGVTLEDAVKQYLKDQEVRASSRKCKRVRLEPFARANRAVLVSGLTAEMVRVYCYRPALKTSTQQRYLYELRQFVEYCRARGWIRNNPADEVRRSTPKRKKRQNRDITEYLSPDEVRRILAAIDADLEDKPQRRGRAVLKEVILFAVLTGLRLGEICNLRWSDVRLFDPPKKHKGGSLAYGWINVRSTEGAETKTGDSAAVPVVGQCYELLKGKKQQRGTSGYVFEAVRTAAPLNGWWVSNRFRYYRVAASIREEIHFHSLRHTCASWLAEQGVDLKVIQEVMRHSNIKQTMRYAHLIPEVVANKMVGAFARITII